MRERERGVSASPLPHPDRERLPMPAATVDLGPFRIGPGQRPAVIAGPCVIESTEHCLLVAEAVARICRKLNLGYIFKCSFDKANRTSNSGFRGPGMESGLATLAEVRRKVGVPVLTDVHLPEQAAPVGEVCDVVQIPAF